MTTLYDALKEEPLVWGMHYCPHHFRDPSPGFHTKILEEALKHRYFAIASPRESAKSTILAFLLPTHAIAYKKKRFIVIVSNTYKKAATSLETIKKELRDNVLLSGDFKIQCVKDSEGDSVFKHPDGFECRVLSKGAEQIGSIRGEKFGAYRPDLIIGDDIEDDELVRSPERRKMLQEVFDEALIPAGDRENCQYIFIGTILHDDSQMAKLVSKEYYTEYRKLLYKALITKGDKLMSLWQEKWSVDYLLKLQKEKPSVFAKEYQNDPVAGLAGKFKREDFRYWAIENNEYILFDEGRIIARDRLDTCKAAIACDLAWEEKRESDYSVILPGFLTRDSYILVDDYICKKGMRPHEIEEILFNMEIRLRNLTNSTVYVGFEKAKLEKVIKFMLRQAMTKRNHWLAFKDLIWDADKVQRIITRLEPRYAMHSIFHKRNMGDLEHQLERFPSGTHDDICFVGNTKIATLFGDKYIKDIKMGDLVLTPNGFNCVVSCGITGKSKVIENIGLIGTPNHPIVDTEKGLVQLSKMCYTNLSKLTRREILVWQYKNLLYLMARPIGLWGVVGKENIISVSQQKIQNGSIPRDFTWRFGNFLMERKFQKALLFTIKTVTLSIMTSLIWSVYLIGNTLNTVGLIGKKIISILKKLDHLHLYGINRIVVEVGTENTVKDVGIIGYIKNTLASFVERFLNLGIVLFQIFAPTNTVKNILFQSDITERIGTVRFVENSFMCPISMINSKPAQEVVEQNLDIQNVYNITVENSHLYYANGILVGNCDSLQGLCQLLQYPKGKDRPKPTTDAFEWWRTQAIQAKKPSKRAFVWGAKAQKKHTIPYKQGFN